MAIECNAGRGADVPWPVGTGTGLREVRGMSWTQVVEFSFYLVETFALPFAIVVFLLERRKQLVAAQEELYQRLSDEYMSFLKLVLDNADLQLLRRRGPRQELTEEQLERKHALFGILVSIFETAYILVYEEKMDRQTRRLWSSWEDYMREWCGRADFRAALPELLEGEDPDFRRHIGNIARAAEPAVGRPATGNSLAGST
jgi:hypothetical protein